MFDVDDNFWPDELKQVTPPVGVVRTEASVSEFTRNFTYESCDGVREALRAIQEQKRIIFVSGGAGTGKSRLIKYIENMHQAALPVIAAPTGVSAIALEADTIHSLFRIPIGVQNSLDMPPAEPPQELLNTKMIIIDELSMVRADTLDAIDSRMKFWRGSAEPFGGVQVVMLGDFWQLPPVTTSSDASKLVELGYQSPFAFSSNVMTQYTPEVVKLTKTWRQVDKSFVAALEDVRKGHNKYDVADWLNERCYGQHRELRSPIYLTSTKDRADYHNRIMIEKLRSSNHVHSSSFASRRSGIFEDTALPVPAPDLLNITVGSRVMALKNAGDGSYANGTLGTVVSLRSSFSDHDEDLVRVRFDGSDAIADVKRTRWVSSHYEYDISRNTCVNVIKGWYEQIPLAQGYALTIHKSQGLSLDDVRIDVGEGAFAPGQVYVALSRARTISGLSLERRLRPDDIILSTKFSA